MPTLARYPVREARPARLVGEKAFTLIELLTVIAIIGILAAITLGVISGVRQRAAISQAKAELSSLSQALEAYKLQYGDYPQAGTNVDAPEATSLTAANAQYILFNSLAGKLGPAGASIKGRSFIDLSRFSLFSATALPDMTTSTAVSNAFVDPWGRLYMYYYKASGALNTTWKSYVLCSVGPDGNVGIGTPNATTGVYAVSNAQQEADNIYANR